MTSDGVPEEDQAVLAEFVDGERAVRHLVPPAIVERLVQQTPPAEITPPLWSAPEILILINRGDRRQ
jgi:hypothetical protein